MSRSPIRTATQTSGKPRRRKWTLRALTTVVLTAGSLASLAGPAQAYDQNDCYQKLGWGNVASAYQGYAGSSRLVFADGPWVPVIGGGSLHGDAVLCWAVDGGVAYIGRLIADTTGQPIVGTMDVTAYSASGSATTPKAYVVRGNWGANIQISERLAFSSGTVTSIRFRFYENGVLKWTWTKSR